MNLDSQNRSETEEFIDWDEEQLTVTATTEPLWYHRDSDVRLTLFLSTLNIIIDEPDFSNLDDLTFYLRKQQTKTPILSDNMSPSMKSTVLNTELT